MCHAARPSPPTPVPWTSRASRSKTGFGVKGERFTPKAGHDPGIVSPEAGSRFCAEQCSAPAHPPGGGAVYVPGLSAAIATEPERQPRA